MVVYFIEYDVDCTRAVFCPATKAGQQPLPISWKNICLVLLLQGFVIHLDWVWLRWQGWLVAPEPLHD